MHLCNFVLALHIKEDKGVVEVDLQSVSVEATQYYCLMTFIFIVRDFRFEFYELQIQTKKKVRSYVYVLPTKEDKINIAIRH